MFTVAKSAGYDILGDMSGALDDALKNGTTFEDFKKQIIPILQQKGWWGQGPAFDPLTGETTIEQLGSLRRLKVIFDTNMRVSYAAGRWASIQRNKVDRPYLCYLHTTSEHPRPEHLAWDGITLPVDDPFWDTHYPPNGWGCKCGVMTLSQRQYEQSLAEGSIITERPLQTLIDFINGRTGETTTVPKGIDPGWGYNVGQAFMDAIGITP